MNCASWIIGDQGPRRNQLTDLDQMFDLEGRDLPTWAPQGQRLDFVFIDWHLIIHNALSQCGEPDPRWLLDHRDLLEDLESADRVVIFNLLGHTPVSELVSLNTLRPRLWPNRDYELWHTMINTVQVPSWITEVHHYNYHFWIYLAYMRSWVWRTEQRVFTRCRDARLFYRPTEFNPSPRSRSWVSANKTRPGLEGRLWINTRIRDLSDGYQGRHDYLAKEFTPELYLRGQQDDPGLFADTWQQISHYPEAWRTETALSRLQNKGNLTHHSYYQQSYWSLVGECLDQGPDTIVSEKSIWPIYQGSLPMIYGGPGIYQYLESLGIKFPRDWPRDHDRADPQRFTKFCGAVEQLLSRTRDQWQDYYLEHLGLLTANANRLQTLDLQGRAPFKD